MSQKQESIITKQGLEGTIDEITKWVRGLHFKKKLFGGVDEDDVLKKLEELNRLYEQALLCERARYDALLKQSGGDDTGIK